MRTTSFLMIVFFFLSPPYFFCFIPGSSKKEHTKILLLVLTRGSPLIFDYRSHFDANRKMLRTLSSSHRQRIHVRNPQEEKMAFADIDRNRVEIDPPLISSEEQPVDDESAINQRLSKSLMRLDFKDRNLIGEEIHGVISLAPDETPHLINDSLQRMNDELNAIVTSSSRIDKQAFQAAQLLPKTYVNDRNFRLKFLRCELFDPIKAADRMIVYMDYLLLLFGHRVLEEPLNLSFFADEEAAAMREGHVQLLPFRDRRGRRVMIVLPKALSYTPTLRVSRCNVDQGLASADDAISLISSKQDTNCRRRTFFRVQKISLLHCICIDFLINLICLFR